MISAGSCELLATDNACSTLLKLVLFSSTASLRALEM
jgi:hypothetical protein